MKRKVVISITIVMVIIVNMVSVFAIDIPSPSNTQPYNGYFQNLPDTQNGFYLFQINNEWVSVYNDEGKIGFCFVYLQNDYDYVAFVCESYTHMNINTNGTVEKLDLFSTVEGHTDLKFARRLYQKNSLNNIAPNYIFNSWDDGINAIVNYIENPIPPVEPTTINYDLPAGNVAYIKLASGFDGFGLTTTMPVKSDAFSSSTGWNSTQRWGFTDTIATSGTQLANFGSQISWEKNTSQTNIFGQTQEAYYYPEGPFIQSDYLVIVNPLYYAIQYTNGEGIFPSDSGVNQTVNNNSIHINCDDAISITVFQLTQNVTINNNVPTYTNDVTSGPYEGEVDPDTGDITWTDPDGGSNQPTIGGGNVPGTGETSFTSVINGIANRIVNVFQPAHDAIITLSNAVTNFAGWLYALYVWLPAPILTLLTSAISVAIIIGVIKVFI